MAETVSIRLVTLDDMLLLFQWANDPDVRNFAFRSEPIQLDDHKLWFENKLNSNSCSIYILEKDSIPVGQIRFDKSAEDKDYKIDYSISKEYRGQGLGNKIIQFGVNEHKKEMESGYCYLAEVKKDNTASQKCFENCGFRLIETTSSYFIYKLSIVK